MTTDHDRCDAAQCGRRHGIQHFGGAWDGATLCAFHAHDIRAGVGIPVAEGTAYYDNQYGTVILPDRWQPRIQETTE